MCACGEPSTDDIQTLQAVCPCTVLYRKFAMLKLFLSVFLFGVFMSIIDMLFEKEVWELYFLHKKESGNISQKDLDGLREFIDREKYISVAEKIKNGQSFSFPRKKLINKSAAGKKRAVYTFNSEENHALKLMSFLLRDYDYLFERNLYSFRKGSCVKKAVEDILRIKDLDERYVYRADISDYFNSVDIDILLPELEMIFSDDREFFGFISSLLTNPYVEYDGEIVCDKKGIMAGVPVSAFLANVYLRDLDKIFSDRKIPYMRYSDDILVFAKDEAELSESIKTIDNFLYGRRLKINGDKRCVSGPHEKWIFLGFSYHEGTIDISEVSFGKLKAKMRRKTRSLSRWAARKNLPGEYAARAFVRRFNTKLYDNPVYGELTWARWFFPIINTDTTLRKTDEYMQECIRYLATGKRTKSRYDFKYGDIKNLGYRSLVNEYYRASAEKQKP